MKNRKKKEKGLGYLKSGVLCISFGFLFFKPRSRGEFLCGEIKTEIFYVCLFGLGGEKWYKQ